MLSCRLRNSDPLFPSCSEFLNSFIQPFSELIICKVLCYVWGDIMVRKKKERRRRRHSVWLHVVKSPLRMTGIKEPRPEYHRANATVNGHAASGEPRKPAQLGRWLKAALPRDHCTVDRRWPGVSQQRWGWIPARRTVLETADPGEWKGVS